MTKSSMEIMKDVDDACVRKSAVVMFSCCRRIKGKAANWMKAAADYLHV
ncbi:hypothetical protein KS4_07030 [Poriferisphaera corsica]|uniref:Uncharacterized protein n=1 Tax=Poriferisphaera corsica TaxID=2528020 RepID=A0A517YR21_9BACT|nr:hypothetical protein KS4_07030 [Poriferisphaera corsica]